MSSGPIVQGVLQNPGCNWQFPAAHYTDEINVKKYVQINSAVTVKTHKQLDMIQKQLSVTRKQLDVTQKQLDVTQKQLDITQKQLDVQLNLKAD